MKYATSLSKKGITLYRQEQTIFIPGDRAKEIPTPLWGKITAKRMIDLTAEEEAALLGLDSKIPALIAPDWLGAISIHAPYAYAICLGLKDEEYRSRSTKYRGWALIHSSGSKASDEWLETYGLCPKGVARQAIIGAAEILDCYGGELNFNGDPDGYAYKIGKYILFPEPLIGIKGRLQLFWKPKPEEQKKFDACWSYICHKTSIITSPAR